MFRVRETGTCAACRFVVAMLSVLALGCADVEGDSPGASGTGGGGKPGGTGGGPFEPEPPPVTGDETVELLLKAIEESWLDTDGSLLNHSEVFEGMRDVQVCELADGTWLETDNCVTTDAEGRAALRLPADKEVAVSVLPPDGYIPYIYVYVTTAEDFVRTQGHGVWRTSEIDHILEIHLDQSSAVGLGTIAATCGWGNITEGLSTRIVGAEAEPVYLDAENLRYTFDLDATTVHPFAYAMPLAQAGFVGLPQGTYEVFFDGAPECGVAPRRSWPGSEPNSIRLPVRQGYITFGVCRFQ